MPVLYHVFVLEIGNFMLKKVNKTFKKGFQRFAATSKKFEINNKFLNTSQFELFNTNLLFRDLFLKFSFSEKATTI